MKLVEPQIQVDQGYQLRKSTVPVNRFDANSREFRFVRRPRLESNPPEIVLDDRTSDVSPVSIPMEAGNVTLTPSPSTSTRPLALQTRDSTPRTLTQSGRIRRDVTSGLTGGFSKDQPDTAATE